MGVATVVVLLRRLGGGALVGSDKSEVAAGLGVAWAPPNSTDAPIPPSEAHVDQHVPAQKPTPQILVFGTAKRVPIASSRGELAIEYQNFFRGASGLDLDCRVHIYKGSAIRAKRGSKPGISKNPLLIN